jgi:hypothetical protein
MLIPFGILSSAASVEVGETYELIASEILTASQSSITFSNLGDYSSTYKHLQVRAVTRYSGNADNYTSLLFRINGDSGNNYSNHRITTDPTFGITAGVSQSFGASSINAGASAPTNAFGVSVIDFLDAYSTTKNKTARHLGGLTGAASTIVGFGSSLFINTASITSIQLFSAFSLSFVAGTRISLYGIKG